MLQLQLKRLPAFPKVVRERPIYGIVSRNTLLGYHREIIRPDVDLSCTKTVVMFATDEDLARNVMEKLESLQARGFVPNRNLQPHDQIIFQNNVQHSLMPYTTESFPYTDIEKLCMLHFFDLNVIYNVHEGKNDELQLDCYEYSTSDWPNRSSIELYMRDMLYKC